MMSEIQQSAVECVFQARAQLGEGPSWLPWLKRVLWIDIEQSRVHLFDPVSRSNQTFDIGCHVGCAVPGANGNIFLATARGFGELSLHTGQVSWITHPEAHLPGNRFNDGKTDPSGRFWAGSLAYSEAAGAAGLYLLDEKRQARQILAGITISNGLAWTADHRTFYYIDTPTMRVEAFDFDKSTSAISARRTCSLRYAAPRRCSKVRSRSALSAGMNRTASSLRGSAALLSSASALARTSSRRTCWHCAP